MGTPPWPNGGEITVDVASGGPAPPVRVGSCVGPYVVVEEVGRGGMGVVYKAFDNRLERAVALKFHIADNPGVEGTMRVFREAKALAALAHPNVVSVYDVGFHGDRVYVVMEWVAGQDLHAWLKSESRTSRKILEVFAAAARGLQAAHDAGIVHRDFKLANAMVGDDGRVRVLDFGLARPVREECAQEGGVVRTVANDGGLEVTEAGALLGTPAYIPPERWSGEAKDALGDQYSFCVALFMALYGRHPFEGRSAIGDAPQTAAHLPHESAGRRVPAHVLPVVTRGLSQDPSKRYPSLNDLIDALMVHPAARRRRRLAALATLAVLAAAVAVWLGIYRATDPCVFTDDGFAATWNASRQERLRAAMATVASPIADSVLAALSARLDAHARQWNMTRRQICELHAAGDRAFAQYQQKLACMQRNRRAVDYVLTALVDGASRERVERAPVTLDPLMAPSCAELDAGPELQLSASQRTLADEFEEELTQAQSEYLLGNFSRAVERTRQVADRARGTDGMQLYEAKALVRHFKYVSQTESDAGSLFETARDLAVRAGAGAQLVELYRLRLAGHLFHHETQAAKESLAVLGSMVAVGQVRGLALAEVLSTQSDALGPLGLDGDGSRRLELALRAQSMLRELGLEESDAMIGVLISTGDHYAERRERPAAMDAYEQAVAIGTRVYGQLHPSQLLAMTNLGILTMEMGNYAQAVEQLSRVLDDSRRINGPDAEDLLYVLLPLAESLRKLGRVEQAWAITDEVERLLSLHVPRTNMMWAWLYLRRGALHADAGDLIEAKRELDLSADLFAKTLQPDDSWHSLPWSTLAEAYLRAGRVSEALPLARQTLALHTRAVHESDIPDGQSLLGRVLWERNQPGDREEAARLVRVALVALVAQQHDPADIEHLRAWMRQRGLSSAE